MREISFRALVAALIVGVIGLPAFAAAQPKAGATCTKKGATATANNKKFTCVLKGKKLVWNSGVLISVPVAQPTPTPTPSPTQPPVAVKVDFSQTFNTDDGYYTLFEEGACQYDKNIPSIWAAVQDYFRTNCSGISQVAKYELGNARPKTAIDTNSEFENASPCKVLTPPGSPRHTGYTTSGAERNKWHADRSYPSPNAVIQFIPFYTEDMKKPDQAPSVVYGKYLDFFKEWIDYSSDFGSKAEIRIPDQYLKVTGKLSDYPIQHENGMDHPANNRFKAALIASVDPFIDFKGANIVIAAPPPGTSFKEFGQGFLNTLETAEGKIYVSMAVPGYLAAYPEGGGFILGHPFMWIHELMHAGIGFEDTYIDHTQTSLTEYGMGRFGLMSPWGGDLVTWMKWRLNFMRDSQIRCVSSVATSTHWIVPSTVKSTLPKSVVVSLSPNKAIVIESLRPGGLHYKLATVSQGVLVYTVDTNVTISGGAMVLSLPAGRAIQSKPFWMGDATLKLGEYTISNGYKITVVESGTFGDVVRVEKL